ncbi:MAG: DUF4097 family beta strand repeat-containing protein [bacterium]|nr:DUF4097 family beta strand repeat-containing protein [bacterium]
MISVQEEVRVVLEMLRDKKITINEAKDLISALDETSKSTKLDLESKRDGQVDKSNRLDSREVAHEARLLLRREIREAGDEAKDAIREIKGIVREGKDLIVREAREAENIIKGIVRSGTGYSRIDTYSGQIINREATKIIVNAVNGKINVRVGSNDGRWVLATEVATRSESENANNLYAVEEGKNTIIISAKKLFGQMGTVNFDLTLPANCIYNFELNSINGTIAVGRLKAEELRATTTNGKIIVEADAAFMSLGSTNGKIFVGGCGTDISCKTVNGAIEIRCAEPVAGGMKLGTVNGDIAVAIGGDESVAVVFSAETVYGSIQSELRQQAIVLNEKRALRRYMNVETPGQGKERLEIAVQSVYGKITIKHI